jgi:hypothetical protein
MATEKDLDDFYNKQREFTAAEMEKEKTAMAKGVGEHPDSELAKDTSIVKDEKIKEKHLHWRGGWGWGNNWGGGWGNNWGWGNGGWRAPGFWYGGPSFYGWGNGWWGPRGWW